MSRLKTRWISGALAILSPFFLFAFWLQSQRDLENTSWPSYSHEQTSDTPGSAPNGLAPLLDSVARITWNIINNPSPSSAFAEMGERVQGLRSWLEVKEQKSVTMARHQMDLLASSIETTAIALFPFLRNPSRRDDLNPLENLRQSYNRGSKGIVIPTGKGTFRYACHLIGCLRNVLNSQLPIQIAYANDEDLPLDYRNFIVSLGTNIVTLDVSSVLDDETLHLAEDGWAIKPFAVLASTLEQVMLLDADAVLVQAPEAVFDRHNGYLDTGALFFHDRLLWQGAFKERHAWWEEHLKHHAPSKSLMKSLVYNDGYAEECDSGLLVIDKSRLSILLGLLHVCWQNTLNVRRDWTYKMGYGDKESWWFGLELSDAEYVFESHYGAVLGHLRSVAKDGDGRNRVCGFTIAHTDENDKLLWYNGSLLKNKAVNDTEFDVPEYWMTDAVWEKGATKPDISCMRDGEVRSVEPSEKRILQESVDAAKKIDERIKELNLF